MHDEVSARAPNLRLAGGGRDYLRVKHIAEELDVHPSTVYRAVAAGVLPALRIGAGRGGLRVSRAAYEGFLARRLVAPVADTEPSVRTVLLAEGADVK